MPQLGHGAGMQLLGMQPAASADLLLSQSAAPIELIWMSFNLRLDRLLPEHVVGVVVSPCQKLSSGSLPTLQHIAGIRRHGSGGGDLNGHRDLLIVLNQFCSNGYRFYGSFTELSGKQAQRSTAEFGIDWNDASRI